MSEKLHIFHGERMVGSMAEARNDMWYMEGPWIPAEGASDFELLLRQQDFKRNLKEGRGLEVRWSEGGSSQCRGLIIGLVDGHLVMRMLIHDEPNAIT